MINQHIWMKKMCRLFGLVANKEVDIEFSFIKADRPFRDLGIKNPDGWGIGYYQNDNAIVFKEPVSTFNSSQFYQKAKHLYSSIIISHVRKSSQGGRKKENTHPFNYNNWIFAHNGNIDIKELIKEQLLHKYIKSLKGETDSEIFFFWLIQNMDEYDIIKGIKRAINFIEGNKGDRTSSLNFLLTNGEKLYALRKAFSNTAFYSLFYLVRDPQNNNITSYVSKETNQLIQSKKLSDEKSIVICSEKMTSEENWIPISNSSLMIVEKKFDIKHLSL